MSNFLIPIQAPALNSPTFARDIQEIFENINENFRRMASAPYLEGQEGKSVTTVDMPIVENDELTEFGIEMCRVIFNDDNIDSISYIDNVVAQPITNIKVTDYLKEHPIMKVMATYDPDTDAVTFPL